MLKLSPVLKLSSLQGMRMEDERKGRWSPVAAGDVEAVVAAGDPSKREIEEIRWSQLEDERRLWRKTGGRQWRMKDEGRQWRMQVGCGEKLAASKRWSEQIRSQPLNLKSSRWPILAA